MNQIKHPYHFIILTVLITFLGVACSGTNTDEITQSATLAEDAEESQTETVEGDSNQPSSVEETTAIQSSDEEVAEATPVAEATAAETTVSEDDETAPARTGPVGQLDLSWELTQIDEGIKPAFDLDANGNAHIAYLTEEEMGGVFYATNADGEFAINNVASGYFYGPVDLAVGPDDRPFIAYHDHQDTGFDPNLGDEVVAIYSDGEWELVTVEDTGHDGWDNSITIDAEGNWHTGSVDPAQFGSEAGVEYATNAGDGVIVSQVGSGPIVYEFGTSIQLDAEGLPGIAYYNQDEEALAYAKYDGNEWTIQLVDSDGDAGRYAHLIYDANGYPHIAYFVFDGETTGDLRHAWWDGVGWQIEFVDRLEEVRPGSAGARKITALALDGEGGLHIAYSDRGRIVYGQRMEDGWFIQDLPHHSDKILGQLVELELDEEGNPHLIWYEVTIFAPTLTGDIIYAKGA
jgi:hypothetical protein